MRRLFRITLLACRWPSRPAICSVLAVAALLLVVTPPVWAQASPDAPAAPLLFRCEPTSYTGSKGQLAVIDLYAQDAATLYGLDVQVTYDPALAEVIDSDAGAPEVQIQPLSSWFVPGFTVKNVACNAAGGPDCPSAGVIWYAATQLNPQPAIPPDNPNGPFARITFKPLAEGTFTMNFVLHMAGDRNGEEIVSDAQSCPVEFLTPTGVTISDQSAHRTGDVITLRWQTASEQNMLGFALNRSESAGGPWSRLNPHLVLARSPGLALGHTYSWSDETAQPGALYRYRVDWVSTDGAVTPGAPFALQPQTPNAVAVSAFSAAAPASWPVTLLVVLLLLVVRLTRRAFRPGNRKPAN